MYLYISVVHLSVLFSCMDSPGFILSHAKAISVSPKCTTTIVVFLFPYLRIFGSGKDPVRLFSEISRTP